MSETDQKFNALIEQVNRSLTVFEKTRKRVQFTALSDQINALGEEIGGKNWREEYERERFGTTSEEE